MDNEELIDYESVPRSKPKTTNSISFSDLLLKDELTRTIHEIGFEHPSEVQVEALPKAMLGADILCQAKSGTGKTAVFVLSTLQQLEIKDEIKILVITNTKEMALQIKNEYLRFGKYLNLKVISVFGGYPVEDDIKNLQNNPQILIGTVGRILDLQKRQILNLQNLKHFVVDEVDKVIKDNLWSLLQIFLKTPKNKQTLFFSATFSESKEFFKKFLKNPVEITIKENELVLTGLKQRYSVTNDKDTLLTNILDSTDFSQAMIFTNTQINSLKISSFLNKLGFPTLEINGRMSNKEREDKLNQFKSMKFRIIVTTDLMSRGIDVADVNLVINFDMPNEPETYLHRVGRAGRFNTEGIAVSLVCDERDSAMLNEIQEKYDLVIEKI